LPFYASLGRELQIITFNYTSFAKTTNSLSKYFHENLSKYIRLDNRGESSIDDFENINIVDFLKNTIGANIDFAQKKFVIPSIVPPLKLKPVLSNDYIDVWHESVGMIRRANKIVVVGYSFNYADEHFNDLIRKNRDKEIIVIDPYIESVRKNLERIFSYRESDYTTNAIQGKICYEVGSLKLIKAKALEININLLFGIDG
jgi:hypothetical protein